MQNLAFKLTRCSLVDKYMGLGVSLIQRLANPNGPKLDSKCDNEEAKLQKVQKIPETWSLRLSSSGNNTLYLQQPPSKEMNIM